jgi:hypothetical protein
MRQYIHFTSRGSWFDYTIVLSRQIFQPNAYNIQHSLIPNPSAIYSHLWIHKAPSRAHNGYTLPRNELNHVSKTFSRISCFSCHPSLCIIQTKEPSPNSLQSLNDLHFCTLRNTFVHYTTVRRITSFKFLLKFRYSLILSRTAVIIERVWIGEWIYWPLIHTTRKFKQLQRHR